MKLLLASVAIATAITAFAQSNPKIGEVLSIKGQWCRQATVLKISAGIFLEDDIRYCAAPADSNDGIVIRFYANQDLKPPDNTPYDRSYKCTTPGICDKKEKLWLEGAYIRIRSTPSGTPLISVPPTASLLLPDTVIEAGKVETFPDTIFGALGYGASGAQSPIRICILTNGKIGSCANDTADMAKWSTGIYGVFTRTNRKSPAGLVVIVPPGSSAETKWAQVPDAFKTDKSPGTVTERRLYLIDLLKNEKQ
jgi:hypothetical protein